MSMLGISDLPEGDPASADFPSQLTALSDKLRGRVTHSWATLAARTADYALHGEPYQPGVFLIQDDPDGLYVATGVDDDWVRFEKGMPFATGQVRFRWTTEARKSDLKWIMLPPGLFGSRPAPQMTPLNAYGDRTTVSGLAAVTISKDAPDTPSSEVSTGGAWGYAYTVEDGSTLGAGQWRYGYFSAFLRLNASSAWDF